MKRKFSLVGPACAPLCVPVFRPACAVVWLCGGGSGLCGLCGLCGSLAGCLSGLCAATGPAPGSVCLSEPVWLCGSAAVGPACVACVACVALWLGASRPVRAYGACAWLCVPLRTCAAVWVTCKYVCLRLKGLTCCTSMSAPPLGCVPCVCVCVCVCVYGASGACVALLWWWVCVCVCPDVCLALNTRCLCAITFLAPRRFRIRESRKPGFQICKLEMCKYVCLRLTVFRRCFPL